MEIELVKLSEIHGYKSNAKLHPQKQIDQIKQSIMDFGFNDPIAIDEENMIIEGHGRFKAVDQLGWTEVPCIRIEGLTDDQKKAYILAHNKLTMNTGFDLDLLKMEIDSILDFNMEDYGFDFPDDEPVKLDPDPPDEPEDDDSFHRDTTINQYHLDLVDLKRCAGRYQMPIIKKTDFIPSDLIGFNYMLTSPYKHTGIHCFVDDYQFQRLWTSPETYISKLAEYECFLSPDFSLYLDMPYSMKVWNVFRSRLIGQYYQDKGLEVIPTISWAEPETFDFCFDDVEPGGVVAISTIGVKENDNAFDIWVAGMDEMIERLHPSTILCYGGSVDYDYGDIPVVYYENKVTERMKKGAKK